MTTAYTVGEFEVRPAERRVLARGEPVALGARAFDLLLALIEHHDRVVGKDELLARVWPGVVVEENNLTVQVSALRKVLGAESIATVAGRGYRLTLPLRHEPQAVAPAVSTSASRAGSAPDPPQTPHHNLAAERSSFIGRVQEIQTLRRAIAEHRLVTLTGIGGSGKTRLALQAGRLELGQAPPRLPDGIFFVDLAPVADPDLVAPTLAAACGLAPGDSPVGHVRSFADRLVTALAPRRCLLLVDNCEHLLDAAADLIDQLLAGCAGVVVLATSREALGVDGEQVLQVPSLALPDEGSPAVVSDAMRLFADRAQAAQASFRLDATTLAPVAEICRRLDGIPLAIELAAARVAHLSPAQVAERLGDRFRLLTGGRRRIARQQTLRAALDWSHGLLAASEQLLFRRLAVFAGSFTLAAAEGVCSEPGSAVERHQVLDGIGSLVAKSLLIALADECDEARYRLLETVRLYALDKLDAAGETAALRSRHRDHQLAWLGAMTPERVFFDVDAIAAIDREIDNLRAAADWCLADGRPELLARMAAALYGCWFIGNSYRAAKRMLEQALGEPERLATDERQACHAILAWLSVLALDLPAARRHAACGIDLAGDRSGPFPMLALACHGFSCAISATFPGADAGLHDEARGGVAAAVEMARRGLPDVWVAQAEFLCGHTEMHLGEVDAGARWYGAAVGRCERLRWRSWLLPAALSGLANALHLQGRDQAALDVALRFLALPGRAATRGSWLDGLAVEVVPALVAGGHQALADQELRKGAAAMRHNGIDLAPNHFLGVAAVAEVLRGRPDRAARLLGAARRVGGADRETMGFRTPGSLALYLHYVPRVQAALGPEGARRHRDEGRALSLDAAFAAALQGLEGGLSLPA